MRTTYACPWPRWLETFVFAVPINLHWQVQAFASARALWPALSVPVLAICCLENAYRKTIRVSALSLGHHLLQPVCAMS